jgi:16S rRNA processing protein RimM
LTDDRPAASAGSSDERLIPIGRIAAAHGVRGWLRMQVFGDGGEALRPGVTLHVTMPEGGVQVFELRQVTAGRKAGEARVALAGVLDREAAEALRGSGVAVVAEALGEAADDEVWVHELVGCSVEGEDGVRVGEIRGLWEAGSADVLVVAAADGREHLVPAALLRDIDLTARRVVVELLPGLIDDSEGAEKPLPDLLDEPTPDSLEKPMPDSPEKPAPDGCE